MTWYITSLSINADHHSPVEFHFISFAKACSHLHHSTLGGTVNTVFVYYYIKCLVACMPIFVPLMKMAAYPLIKANKIL